MWKKINVDDYVVSFDQAVKLYELGMDEPTMCAYHHRGRALYLCDLSPDGTFYRPDEDIPAPLKAQVRKWFRENFNLHSVIENDSDNYYYVIQGINNFNFGTIDSSEEGEVYKTYEEAEDKCINKLIELAKQQK